MALGTAFQASVTGDVNVPPAGERPVATPLPVQVSICGMVKERTTDGFGVHDSAPLAMTCQLNVPLDSSIVNAVFAVVAASVRSCPDSPIQSSYTVVFATGSQSKCTGEVRLLAPFSGATRFG